MKSITSKTGLVVALSVLILSAGTATAGGWGGFIEYGRNIAAPGGDLGSPPSNVLSLLDRNELSIGFTTDSNLADESKLTNFRFDIGYHRAAFANSVSQAVFGASNGAMMNGALGFGILRTSALRLWLGPAVRMNFDWYGDASIFDYQVGIGPQAGLNFNFGSNLTAAVNAAYNYKWGWNIDTSGFNDPIFSHRDHYIMVNLSLYLRND